MFDHPVIILSIFTLVAVLAIGFWQWSSVRRSQARHGEKPGEVTMTRHEPADTSPLPGGRAAATAAPSPSGDVSSYKLQDREAAAEEQRGKTPVGVNTPR